MKNGFKGTLDYILSIYGMRTRDTIGTIVGSQPRTLKYLRNSGYRVETGLKQPNYDFIIFSKNLSYLGYIRNSLTKIDNGCIIIFRVNDEDKNLCLCDVQDLGHEFSLYEFADGKYFGVIVKGLIHESKS